MATLSCSPQEAFTALQSGATVLDVREYPEWAALHVEGARHLPLRKLAAEAAQFAGGQPVYLLCRSGHRAQLAAKTLEAGGAGQLLCIAGGIEAWKTAGLPTASSKGPMSMERQVRIAAGSLVLLGLLVPQVRAISYFVGAGLVFAGVTDRCGLALLLARLPWNKGQGASCSSPATQSQTAPAPSGGAA